MAAPSIRRELLAGLLSVLVLVWLSTGLLIYISARHQVKDVFDVNLVQFARVLATLLHHEARENDATRSKLSVLLEELGPEVVRQSSTLRGLAKEYLSTSSSDREERLELFDLAGEAPEYASKVVFRVYTEPGRLLTRSTGAPPLTDSGPGFSDQTSAGRDWRVYTMHADGADLRIQVAEEKNQIRSELIANTVNAILWPGLISLALLGLLIWRLVGRGLSPLGKLADEMKSREPHSLQALALNDTRRELEPIVDALNSLFSRVRRALDNERRFTSNAAHELRTPLAALRVHAQALQIGMPPDAPDYRSVQAIIDGADRTTHLLEQLLAIARADSARAQPSQFLDLEAVTIEALGAISPLALDKNIGLGLDTRGDARPVPGDGASLDVLLRNLLDNAVRYTPSAGEVHVDLDYSARSVRLSVCDDGPGIPAAEQERMRQRFQRGEDTGQSGSGLGLSIVSEIAELHGADVAMGPGLHGRGLCVSVELPLAAASGTNGSATPAGSDQPSDRTKTRRGPARG